MEMELKHLLESGPLYYYPDKNNFGDEPIDSKEWRVVENIIGRMDLFKDPVLKLVTSFARKNLDVWYNEYDDTDNNLEVTHFCYRHVYSLCTQRKRIEYKERFRRYKKNKVVQDSIRNFGLDPDQFWYFFLFCKDYVDIKITRVEIKERSIKEDLELLVQQIQKMNFSNTSWGGSYPQNIGELSISIPELKTNKTITITNPRTIHLISYLITEFLKGEHDSNTEDILTVRKESPTRNYLKLLYYSTKEKPTAADNKAKLSFDCFDGMINSYELEETKSKWQKIAIQRYFVCNCFCEPKEKKNGLITDKLILFSLLLYLNGQLTPEEDSKISKEMIDGYFKEDPVLLRDYVWDNIKKYKVDTEDELKKFREDLSLKKLQKASKK